ncbi:nuclease of thermonuclease family [Candidatus Arthromitus sp. SFB-mouse-Japan]|uniref:thermonuclease family protein n=1 Tax=Candidatus Arthromitus sp. SFB-mouse TaxID=49118 RepID=UPI00021B7D12|nr:thermonuclease family protein [Candidatus Arthromitus sp. SFB-mouse]EIA22450.1 Nuclease of thermonuclease family [Candidatus Arthromitus sp. SFB-2]EIA25083.1 Nuclease of thermonuclease family [Candidatus Arthromitus sp. SFB-1]EIA26470.1 Nuclease of thermonuclease family [Candidatus Arthromitus sp. SFB-5]EIA27075.1 Nuclease of thermonuclease family [Candidatus Arthromitus sp. SFB-co]EIA31211.1 Nuclease of thermonuclease family [Candidatus Arthromitus sp. SFB-mouse-SU]
MKFKFVYLFMVLIILLGFTMSCSFEDKNLHKVQFNKVIDGNTIKVIIDEELKDVRLILVDSPELRGNYPFGVEAKKYLDNKLSNVDYVYLELNGEEMDKHGKIWAYVWYYNDKKELEMINEDIIENGYGRLAYIFDSAKYLKRLKASQDRAKERQENIWSIDGYVTEDGYKKSK